jgi:hypothetical protein
MKNDIGYDARQNADSTTGNVTVRPVDLGLGAMIGCEAGIGDRAHDGGEALLSACVDQGVSEQDSAAQDAYWRDTHQSRPYYDSGYDYDDYRPAYRYGWELRDTYSDTLFEELESDLEDGWQKAKGNSALSWQKAKHATRDAWERSQKRRMNM